MLRRDPATRPTAVELLHHPWLRQLDARGGGGLGANGSSVDGAGSVGSSMEEAPLSDTLVQRLQRYGTYGRLKQVCVGGGRAGGLGGDASMQLSYSLAG
jgi:hypothetical protein